MDNTNGKTELINPFIDVEDEDDEMMTPQQFINPLLVEDEEDEIYQGIAGQPQNGTEATRPTSAPPTPPTPAEQPQTRLTDDLRAQVQRHADNPSGIRYSVSNRVSTSVPNAETVKQQKAPKKYEQGSEFYRSNIDEVVIDEAAEQAPKKKRAYNEHILKDGRMTGKELEFFRNIKLSKYDKLDEKALILSNPRTPAEKKARNILYAEATGNENIYKKNNNSRFSKNDEEVLKLLAKFRYMKTDHLAIAMNRTEKTLRERLYKLRKEGLVINKQVYGTTPIWFLTEAGMLLSGYRLPRITDAKMSMMLFAHSFAVSHTAANLYAGSVNVLGIDDFPELNRTDTKGKKVRGETLVSELQINSAFGKQKQFEKSDLYIPDLKRDIDRSFDRWKQLGGTSFGQSPERLDGNGYMWALLPPNSHRHAFHVPDLVVSRERNADGSPESIAVEVELSNKEQADYEKVLRAYHADTRIYKKVVWVVKGVGAARKLERSAKNIGLWDEGRIGIVPILTKNGIYQERDLWYL